MVAPLRISGEAKSGQTSASSGTVSPSAASTSLRVSAAPISTGPSVETPRSSGSRSTATTYDARRPRRLASTPQSVDPATTTASGCSARSVERLGEVGGTGEPVDPGRHRRGRGARLPLGQRVHGCGTAEGAGRVADRAVAGAAAEVAGDRVQVEPVRPCLAVGPVVLRRHRAGEAGRAVAALGAACGGEPGLDRVQLLGRAEPFRGDDLLPVEREGRHQAGVDRRPAAAGPLGAGDHHGAGTALALRAALLGAGETEAAQEVERVGVGGRPGERARLPVDGDLRIRHVLSPRAAQTSHGSGSHGSPVVHAERRPATAHPT